MMWNVGQAHSHASSMRSHVPCNDSGEVPGGFGVWHIGEEHRGVCLGFSIALKFLPVSPPVWSECACASFVTVACMRGLLA